MCVPAIECPSAGAVSVRVCPTTERMWALGAVLAAHGMRWTIDEGDLWALEVFTCRGVRGEQWVRLDPSWRAVAEWLGY